MTDQEKIIALAKLDGFVYEEYYPVAGKPETLPSFIREGIHHDYIVVPQYLTSYDAIIPLVQKMDKVKDAIEMELNLTCMFDATPSEIADALLKAKGYEV